MRNKPHSGSNEHGQYLDSLAEAHVVGQAASEAEAAQEGHPSQAELLVGAQLAVKAPWLRLRADAIEPGKLGARPREHLVHAPLSVGLDGDERGIQEAGLVATKTQLFALDGAEVTQESVLGQPFLGQDAEAAVSQHDGVFAATECPQQLGQGGSDAVEIHSGGDVEPVDTARHIEVWSSGRISRSRSSDISGNSLTGTRAVFSLPHEPSLCRGRSIRRTVSSPRLVASTSTT